MTVSWRWRPARTSSGPAGVSSMMVVTLVVGIGLALAGLLAIGFGIPIKEFSFGNTLILAGVMVSCTGFVLLGLWMAVRELKSLAQRLGTGSLPNPAPELRRRRLFPRRPCAARRRAMAVPCSRAIGQRRNTQPEPSRPHRLRHGTRRSPRATFATRRRQRLKLLQRRARPHRPRSGAICCFPRPRGRNASVPRRARPSL